MSNVVQLLTAEIEEFLTGNQTQEIETDFFPFMTVEDYRQMANSGKFDIEIQRNKKGNIISVSFTAKEKKDAQYMKMERF